MAAMSDRVIVWIALEPGSPEDAQRLDEVVPLLIREDPRLRARAGGTGQTIVAGVSERQLQSIVERLRRDFGVAVAAGPVHVAYKEALTTSAEGEARFAQQSAGREHFAHVKIRISPRPSGEGYRFVSQLPPNAIPERFATAASSGIAHTLTRGVVAGCPIEDVQVELIGGFYDEHTSSETSFKIAGGLACSDATHKAGVVLTEPVMRVEIAVARGHVGAALSDLTRRGGRIEGHERRNDHDIIRARVPLRGLLGYVSVFAQMTAGRGTCSITFDRYEQLWEEPAWS